MRQIRITSKRWIEAEDNTLLGCPIMSDGKSFCYCTNKCAWFRIESAKDIKTENDVQAVYCGDKLIGIIKEKADA